MATRAVYSFTGFPQVPVQHLSLHHDGYPSGAAWRFACALRHNSEPAGFLAAFLSTKPAAEPLASPEQAPDADYRYLLSHHPGADPALQVQGWRRLPGTSRWCLRCGPMALALFIQRFLPAALNSATPADAPPETAPAPG